MLCVKVASYNSVSNTTAIRLKKAEPKINLNWRGKKQSGPKINNNVEPSRHMLARMRYAKFKHGAGAARRVRMHNRLTVN